MFQFFVFFLILDRLQAEYQTAADGEGTAQFVLAPAKDFHTE